MLNYIKLKCLLTKDGTTYKGVWGSLGIQGVRINGEFVGVWGVLWVEGKAPHMGPYLPINQLTLSTKPRSSFYMRELGTSTTPYTCKN